MKLSLSTNPLATVNHFKVNKNKKKEPELTESELQDRIKIKSDVLDLVTPIARKNKCLDSLENPNKPKFELPNMKKWAITNAKCYPTFDKHKTRHKNAYGLTNQYSDVLNKDQQHTVCQIFRM